MKNAKMNTALLVCAAFLFRIVFFNLIISTFNSPQTNGAVKTHFSSVMKRRVNFEAEDNSEYSDFSFAELREEERASEDNEFELNPFILFRVVYSLITHELTNKLKGIVPFYNYLSYSSSHRYLLLQVFRT